MESAVTLDTVAHGESVGVRFVDDQGLGRSVVVAFDDPVELVTVRAEARERFSLAGTAALNPGFARRPRGNGDDRPAARERRRPRYSGVPADGG